jgi:hypothetical protein
MKNIQTLFTTLFFTNLLLGSGFLLLLCPLMNKAQTTYSFSHCGATGRVGPTQSQVNLSYAATNLNGLVATTNATSGIQTFTIPAGVNVVIIEANGAEGGAVLPNVGGKGARMKGTFSVSPGQVLHIVVGQLGLSQATNNCNGGGGGGGSFVYFAGAPQPLVAAGGGGGAHLYLGPGCPGTITTGACTSTNSGGSAGSGGSGGGAGSCGTGWPGGGGAGWQSAGGNTCLWNGQTTEGGAAQFSWLGGKRNSVTSQGTQGQDGSFGGGGAAFHGAGGGGGYSGGGGGGSCYTIEKPLGGGGGSFNTGANQDNNSGVNSGPGRVFITTISATVALAINISQSSVVQCHGQLSAALTASVSGGIAPYTYQWLPSGGTSSVASNLGAGIYTCTATDANNMSVSKSFTISQPAPITGTASSNAVCNNSTISLHGSGASSYTWSGGAVNAIPFTPTASATYSMTGFNNITGCTGTAAVFVTVNQLPNISINGGGTICPGTSTTLSAIGADSYTWNTGSNAANIVVSPSVSSTFTVTGSIGNCSNSASTNVMLVPCTGISALAPELISFKLFPNPSYGQFTIESDLIGTIEIDDATGKRIFSDSIHSKAHQFDLRNFPQGTYFVRMLPGNQRRKILLLK